MGHLYLFLGLTLAAGGLSQEGKDTKENENAIPWEEATKYLGKEVTIEGRVLKVERKPGGVFLYFDPKLAERFQVLIPERALATFKVDPVARFNNRRVRVSGKVEDVWTNASGLSYRGAPFIQVTDPKKITIPKPKSTS
ncbi:MAG TPA: hypothetical protein VGC53_12705 [Vicinamibacteria bacterium]|jgi:hypothetical protein